MSFLITEGNKDGWTCLKKYKEQKQVCRFGTVEQNSLGNVSFLIIKGRTDVRD